MLGFAEFLNEIFDNPIPFRGPRVKGPTHHYSFKAPQGGMYHVTIENSEYGNEAHINYAHVASSTKSPNYHKSETSSPSRVLATVRNIVQHHSSNHPDIKRYTFQSAEHKAQVYNKMAGREGAKVEKDPYAPPRFKLYTLTKK